MASSAWARRRQQDKINRWLINASKKYVTLRPGGSYIHHADSFAIIRGGHLDLCVLGAFQVAENGDFANWSRSETDMPSVGGAMDLAVGAKQVWLLMEHTTKNGESKLMRRCTYPLTAVGTAKRVYTNLAVLDIVADGFVVRDMAPGLSFEALQDVTDAPAARGKLERLRSGAPRSDRREASRLLNASQPRDEGRHCTR